MTQTIFDKIIRKEIPATVVYEDDMFLAFLDINPSAKGHTLLIPKTQYTWIHDAPDEVVAAIFIKAKELINAMRSGLGCDYVQVAVVGNEVPHFHVHLIPRHMNDDIHGKHVSYDSEQEPAQYAEKIILAL